MPINSEDLASLTGADVIDQNGAKVGAVGQIYRDDVSGQAAWASVKSGLFGLRESFVPLFGAEVTNGNITVPYTKDFIKDAPRVDADNHLDDSQQATLFGYYGVDRPARTSDGPGGEPDKTAAFGSEETADELHEARTDRLPVADEDDQDNTTSSEYTTPGGTDGTVTDASNDLPGAEAGAKGATTESDTPPARSVGVHDEQSSEAVTPAAATGASQARAAESPERAADAEVDAEVDADVDVDRDPVSGLTADDVSAAGGDPDWAETHQAHYQQTNPAAQADWAAEETPEEPVARDWSVPSTDPALEEPTKVSRSGYSPDRPAAHSSAYEGHEDLAGAPLGAQTVAGSAGAPPAAGAGVTGALDPTVDEGAVYAADADATLGEGAAVPGEEPRHDGDAGRFGTASPETGDPTEHGATRDHAGDHSAGDHNLGDHSAGDDTAGHDDAVSGAPAQTGTGYPPAIDAETAAYEVPGAERGTPLTGAEPGAALGADVESPADGGTLPTGTDAGVDSGEPGVGADGTDGETEAFGAEGYHPDRDGTDLTDEERERLNRARGAL